MPPKAARAGSEAPLAATSASNAGSNGFGGGAFSSLGPTLASIPPSIYPKDSIKDVAEQLGLTNLRDNVAAALASDVEYRIREVLQDASKYMRHAKRNQLRTSDVDAALRAKNIEPLYGYFPSGSGRSSNPSTAGSVAGPSFRKVQTPSGPIHFIEDQEIDFEKVLSTGPTLTLGKGVGWTAHWLAVEGVQPAVPQNPSPAELGAGPAAASTAVNGEGPAISAKPAIQTSANAGTMPLTPLTPSSAAVGGAGVAVKPLIKHVLSRELQIYYERLTNAILTPPSSANTLGEGANAAAEGDTDAEGEARASAMDVDEDGAMASAKSSKENGAQKGTATSAALLDDFAKRSSGNLVRDAALASLRGDPGLHQLVPYLVQWVGERISYGLLDVQLLGSMMMVVHSLLANPHLHISPYLHQLVPSVLSGLLTASVSPIAGSNKESTPRTSSSYQLRCHAGSLLAYIANTYSTAYPSLRTRIVATLLRALLAGTRKYVDPDSVGQPPKTGADAVAEAEAKQRSPVESAGTKLGAVIGLRRMGTGVVRTFLLSETGIQEPEKAKNPLYLLGRWLEDHSTDEQDAAWIVKEVRGATYSLTAPLLPAVRSVEQEREIVEENYGAYWLGQFGDDVRARKGLLSVREEAAQPVGDVS